MNNNNYSQNCFSCLCFKSHMLNKSYVSFVSERLLSSRKGLLRPERLIADFEQFNGTLLMTVRWRLSQQQLEPSAVEGFQFTWTLLSGVTATKAGMDDTLISQTQTVAAVMSLFKTLKHNFKFYTKHRGEKTIIQVFFWLFLTHNFSFHVTLSEYYLFQFYIQSLIVWAGNSYGQSAYVNVSNRSLFYTVSEVTVNSWSSDWQRLPAAAPSTDSRGQQWRCSLQDHSYPSDQRHFLRGNFI